MNLKTLLFVFFTLCFFQTYSQDIYIEELREIINEKNTPFPFGICSGDPDSNSVVISTNIWPTENMNKVDWLFSEDSTFHTNIQQGSGFISQENGYAFKVEIKHLQPGTTYYYRFLYNGIKSKVGRTKTIDTKATALRFAVASCSNYEWGWFYAYRAIANEKQLDAVLFLGDYIYEYQGNHFSDKPLLRNHLPNHEIVSLKDYRTRYAQYRMDPDLQEMHRLHPMIAIWDDHEFANDCCVTGASNHQTDKEGEWENRKEVAKKVYFEWIPVKDNPKKSIQRSFSYGNLADIFMLDGRLEGRSKALINSMDSNYLNANRSMLGEKQANWLISNLVNSKAKWKIIGNQVIFSEFAIPHKYEKKGKSNMDHWQGYPVERNRIYDSLYKHNIHNIIIATGDAHTSWGIELRKDIKNKKQNIGAEFVTPSITSANFDERIPWWQVIIVKRFFKSRKRHPHLKYLDLTRHGYMLLDINDKEVVNTWKYIKNIRGSKYKKGKKVTMKIAYK